MKKLNPPKSLLRQVGKAIADYQMIQANDSVLLAVSGGKDSLSLLQILIHLQRHAPIEFKLAVITVDPLVEGFDPSPLQAYYQGLNIPYFYQAQAILAQAKQHMKKPSFCAYCSRIKRGIMYRIARENNYNVLALGQHLDDFAESFLMSAFYQGQLQTMKACYLNDSKDIRVIRPLLYIRERQTRDFAQMAKLPVIADSCPACFQHPTERQYIKQLLATQEQHNNKLFPNLLHAMRTLYQSSD